MVRPRDLLKAERRAGCSDPVLSGTSPPADSSSPRPQVPRPLVTLSLGYILLWAVTGLVAYLDVFSTFWQYDDEGFMMLTVKHFLDGYPLYNEIWTHYGPFYYLYKWVVHGVATVPLTNDGVRFVSIVMWLATASACSLVIFALSRSLSMTLLTYVMVFVHLRPPFIYEPGHAQELGVALIALSLLVSVLAKKGKFNAMSAALGAACAALVLTKINVGVFLMVAVALAGSLVIERGWLRVVALAAPAGALALPWGLMRARLSQPHPAPTYYYYYYCLIVSLSLVSLLLIAFRRRETLIGTRHCLVFLVSFTVVAGSICAFVFLKGTSMQGIVKGLILAPNRLALMFARYHQFIHRSGVAWALISIFLAGGYRLARRTADPDATSLTHLVALTKLALGGAIVFWSMQFILRSQYSLYMNYAMPVLWIALLPGVHGEHPARSYFPRLVLVCVAVLQTLQAYPVEGSQQAVGTVAIVLIGVLCIADGLEWLRMLMSQVTRGRALWRAATLAALLPAVYSAFLHASLAYTTYKNTVPLGFPGAERVRTIPERAETYRLLVDALRTSSDTFLCTIGFNSLYFWTGKPAPNRKVITHDLRLFTDQEQHLMVRSLLDHPNAVVIDHPGFFGPRDPSIPLLQDIDREFKSWTHIGQFTLMIRKGRLSLPPGGSLGEMGNH
jgi:hypothetical protein